MPKVELISPVWHYYQTALALSRFDLLGHYITGPSAVESERWMLRLGPPLSRLGTERRLAGLPPKSIRRIWFPEIARRGMQKLGWNGERSTCLHNELFARKAAALMDDCDALHFVSTIGFKAAAKAKRSGAKVICDIRGEHPQFHQDVLGEEAKELGIAYAVPQASYRNRILEELALADRIFVPSLHAKRTFLRMGFSNESLVVCPYGVEIPSSPSPHRHQRREEFIVLFLGNICLRKGVHYLLEGFRKASLPKSKLVLAGPIDPAFRPIMQKYAGFFESPGAIQNAEIQQYYRRADVFAIPSLADSFGLVVLEAMSMGLPVIASENTGAAEVIENGKSGFIVPIRDASAIARDLTYLYEHPDERLAMGDRAAAAARLVSWDAYSAICGKFYQNLFSSTLISPP